MGRGSFFIDTLVVGGNNNDPPQLGLVCAPLLTTIAVSLTG